MLLELKYLSTYNKGCLVIFFYFKSMMQKWYIYILSDSNTVQATWDQIKS